MATWLASSASAPTVTGLTWRSSVRPAWVIDEVNRQINRARVGVVCGESDGAPAILTEYALAGLPVLANSRLCCGLQFITPETGLAAGEGAEFAAALDQLLREHEQYDPREFALSRWGWQASIGTLADELDLVKHSRMVSMKGMV